MGDLLIRNIPEALKAGIAERAAKSGHSLSEEAKILLRRSLDERKSGRSNENAYDLIRSAFAEADALVSDEEHEEFLRAIEKGRQDMGRPVPGAE